MPAWLRAARTLLFFGDFLVIHCYRTPEAYRHAVEQVHKQDNASAVTELAAASARRDCVADGESCPSESLLSPSCCGACDEESKKCVKCLPNGRGCSQFGQCCNSCLVHRDGMAAWSGVCSDATTVVTGMQPGVTHNVGEQSGGLLESEQRGGRAGLSRQRGHAASTAAASLAVATTA
mmetsp:Transcript_31043/g.71011  ORF Transcript_31043/g.71011 Transcript_31043/m.71011 type:complete len:178 (-) Transcript_31043:48-581(-)